MEATRTAMKRRIAWHVARFFLAGVFLYAGVSKVMEPQRFATSIEQYRVFPQGSARYLALFLPWLEIICALSLLTGWMHRGASLLLLALTSAFVILISSAIARNLDISCGCFGTEDGVSLWFSLLRATLCLVASCLVFRRV